MKDCDYFLNFGGFLLRKKPARLGAFSPRGLFLFVKKIAALPPW